MKPTAAGSEMRSRPSTRSEPFEGGDGATGAAENAAVKDDSKAWQGNSDAPDPLQAVAARYAVAITPAMRGAVDPADPDDPVARQFYPDARELETRPEEDADPIADEPYSPVAGIVHRHRDRVLLKASGVCPVYCRFCFRRETVGPQAGILSGEALEAALGYIAEHPEIWEVILTGGDPLILSPRRLSAVLDRLEAIPHVAVIRLHSRVPVVAPERIDDAMLAALDRDKAVWLAVHTNHANELTGAARTALRGLSRRGVALIGQTVLLRGVNDDAATLEALFRALVALRVKPYYLHHPDLAPGTGHFRLDIADGQAIAADLRARASGLCQPLYVLDIPGGAGKVPLADGAARPAKDGGWHVRDHAGLWHGYPPGPGDGQENPPNR